MFSTITSLTALNVQMLPPEDVRMGQGLMGVTRNIGASLGVTVTSVFFERRRAAHQLVSYHEYDAMAPTHTRAVDDVRHYLNQRRHHERQRRLGGLENNQAADGP